MLYSGGGHCAVAAFDLNQRKAQWVGSGGEDEKKGHAGHKLVELVAFSAVQTLTGVVLAALLSIV